MYRICILRKQSRKGVSTVLHYIGDHILYVLLNTSLTLIKEYKFKWRTHLFTIYLSYHTSNVSTHAAICIIVSILVKIVCKIFWQHLRVEFIEYTFLPLIST